MTDTLVDTNVLIDVLDSDPDWKDWSQRQLRRGRFAGSLVINPIIYAEISAAYPTPRHADRAISPGIYRRENLPWEAAFNAGRAYREYRRSGGTKRSPLPDFYIGAHAELRSYALLTRDPARYRQYFPTLKLIAPDTHP
jgi:predicted nucleic acid-binding protein